MGLAMDMSAVEKLVIEAGPSGITAESIEMRSPGVSRSTVNRRLSALVDSGAVRLLGGGRMSRYVSAAPFSIEQIRAYLATDWQSRPPAPFREELLSPVAMLDDSKALRLSQLNARAQPLDRRFLSNFLIDLSWGSQILEGGTYTSLDTQALIEYGQKNQDKPTEDAALILTHKSAIEFLWGNRELSTATISEIQSRLTNRHGIKELEDSDHFLPDAQRGRPRENEDVNINRSAYIPPFRPGTGYVGEAFSNLVETARGLPPVQSAFFLLTRIPYLQVFANGNKRTARLAANLPLLGAGLLPISFVDINKADYIQAMAAFYELGNVQLMEKMFIDGYARSIVRGSEMSSLERMTQPNMGVLASELASYVQSGKFPSGLAGSFIKTPIATPAKHSAKNAEYCSQAVALGEAARLKGVREEQIPDFIQAAQTFLDEAKKAGIELPTLKVLDSKVLPTTAEPSPKIDPSKQSFNPKPKR